MTILLRQFLFNIYGIIIFTQLSLCDACSFAACTVYFLNKTDQTEEVFNTEK
ncbi:hypothetical protein DESC_500070 [Desulfosarcina cetonica]|nr:hypothetical protein DESC_500070 [Desulfosarcina cetonica]